MGDVAERLMWRTFIPTISLQPKTVKCSSDKYSSSVLWRTILNLKSFNSIFQLPLGHFDPVDIFFHCSETVRES